MDNINNSVEKLRLQIEAKKLEMEKSPPENVVVYCTYSFLKKLKVRLWKMKGRYEQRRVLKHRRIFRKRRR